ncbi:MULTISPECIES: aldo/keto reductase [unclassified Streptomyces]|uniref:aldo/keto reductase n=1 Tax=unclassified Streptomyces TaxID=2593676 RepID=UPI0006BF442D|nr:MULTISPECIES: aldo/keto reductase [unclassified Streptomyces]KOX28600.1 oxidoreductase [Streptomyces sp. NRRL F-6491]KOX41888.1 oxidoreductase [Streptomyces sp. NRRL F-6492]
MTPSTSNPPNPPNAPNPPDAARTFSIGGEHRVNRLGFGAMRLPTGPGPEREAAVAVARRAVERGVTLIDTAHLYGWGANEELLAEALHPYPDGLLVTTKVGILRTGPEGWAYDARPESLREQVEQGLRRLRTERVGLLQLHRIDPEVPVAEQIGALRELQREGKIGHIGLSEVTTEQLAEARRTAEIASVQNRYNLFEREHEPVLEACEAAGIAFLPWRPVAVAADSGGSSALAAVATELGATAPQVLLAWLLARSPVVLPIPGTASLAHLEENLAAADLRLTDSQRRLLDRAAAPDRSAGRD